MGVGEPFFRSASAYLFTCKTVYRDVRKRRMKKKGKEKGAGEEQVKGKEEEGEEEEEEQLGARLDFAKTSTCLSTSASNFTGH